MIEQLANEWRASQQRETEKLLARALAEIDRAMIENARKLDRH